jgi:hypothetical protein
MTVAATSICQVSFYISKLRAKSWKAGLWLRRKATASCTTS